MKKIGITGISGFVGDAVARKLNEHGFKIIGFSRRKEISNDIYGTDNVLITDYAELPKKLFGVDCVVHFAAKAHKQERANRNFEAYLADNVTLTRQVAEAALYAGVQTFIYISTIAVYGLKSSNSLIEETHQENPATPYAESKLIAEKELMDMFRNSDAQLIILRPPLIYGKLAPGNFGKLLKFVNLGIPLPLIGVNNTRSCISVDSLAAKIMKVISHEGNASGIYNISDKPDLSTIDLVRLAGKIQGKQVRLFKFFPRTQIWLLKLIGKRGLAETLFEDLKIDTSKFNRKFNLVEQRDAKGRFQWTS